MATTMAQEQSVWIFDLDGTLIDSMTAFRHLAGELIAAHYGVSPTEAEEQYRQTSGLPFVEQMQTLYPDHPNNAETVATFERRKLDYYAQARPFPDVLPVLQILAERGDFLGISSNNGQALVESMVERWELPIHIVCGWRNGVGKGIAHFATMRAFSQAADDAMTFVGDSLHDAALALQHGLGFTGRVGTFAAGEFHHRYPGVRVIRSLRELLS
ncbi:MAG: HAD family hydrolase [Deltaproteobacteria bacterium]|nr:HAD family hydrolase [Deltaproteobacteria bacterium]